MKKPELVQPVEKKGKRVSSIRSDHLSTQKSIERTHATKFNENNMLDHRFAVAPLMDWTDRHCRVFHRLMSRRARLYTEMLTTGAIIHGDRRRLLGFDPSEHPVALQLGGPEPARLATAATIGGAFVHGEI